jgi:hypothetical protein
MLEPMSNNRILCAAVLMRHAKLDHTVLWWKPCFLARELDFERSDRDLRDTNIVIIRCRANADPADAGIVYKNR